MEPGEALTTAAQIAVALAGFAGVVVAFRSKVAARVVAEGTVSLVALARQCPRPPFRLFARHALACDQPNAAFHLALVQRVLAPFEFSFWRSEEHTSELQSPIDIS